MRLFCFNLMTPEPMGGSWICIPVFEPFIFMFSRFLFNWKHGELRHLDTFMDVDLIPIDTNGSLAF